MDGSKLYRRNEKELSSLVLTILIFSKDTGMAFGIEKCPMSMSGKEKIVKSVATELPDGKVIKSLQEGEIYKYLGNSVADRFLREEMKLKVSKSFKVKIEWWEFNSRSQYLSSVSFKIFSSIY